MGRTQTDGLAAGDRGLAVTDKTAQPVPRRDQQISPSQGGQAATKQTPILIYVPGLGTSAENTADVVADVIAEAADLEASRGKYKAEAALDVVTPTGLTVSKKVTGPDGGVVLQLFQANYRTALDGSTTPFAPSVGPGAVRAATLAIVAAAKWWAAATRPGKGIAVKAQLFTLCVLVAALLFAAAVAVAALLVALGVPLGRFEKLVGTDEQAGAWTLGIVGLGTVTWAWLREKILGLAKLSESMLHFVSNHDQVADTVSKRLDKAINDLTDAGWGGPIHLLGYSFGSLVVFESMFPRANTRASSVPAQAVTSLTTIGCPLDIVRLYEPGYISGRTSRREGVAWMNVFNPADVLSSNLINDKDDTTEGTSNVLVTGNTQAESIRYLDETVGVTGILVTGRMHAKYWGKPGSANCFQPLVRAWIPALAPTVATG